jgi:DDE superfamily endonuclease
VEGRTLAPDQKKAIEEGRTVVFTDQTGFYLLPSKVRTYAPVGQTPIIRAPLRRDHLSARGGITPEGKLYLMTQERAYCGAEVVGFLKHLARHIAGKLLVIWDGAPIHRSRVVKEYLSRGATHRIHLEQLPSYAPELNPTETGGVEEPLLSKPLPPVLRTHQSQGAAPAQDQSHSGLHQTTWLLLVVSSGISNSAA